MGRLKFKKPCKKMFEYWLDEDEEGKIIPIKMPYKYVVESVCDMIGASKAYGGNKWQESAVWSYWLEKCKGKRIMHPASAQLVEKLLYNYKALGEKDFVEWYRRSKEYLKNAYESGLLLQMEEIDD